MSDTDDDLVSNSLRCPQENIIHSLNVDNSNLRNYSFRNHNIAPNYNMPNRYMFLNQTSMYSRRKTSPMSLKSFPNSRMDYQQNYKSAMSSQGSVYNTRCRSPMSVRSIDSNASVSVANIALALKNAVFSDDECRLINDAIIKYNQKYRGWKRINKRKRFKSHIKYRSRRLGPSDQESGVEGSDSSDSSDDRRSTRSAFYKENILRKGRELLGAPFNRYTTQLRENDIYKDCTDNLRQNSFRNLLTIHSRTVNHNFMQNIKQYDMYTEIPQNITHRDRYTEIQHNVGHNDRRTEIPLNNTHNKQKQHVSNCVLKARFAEGASSLLPSQRFNKTMANSTNNETVACEKLRQDQQNGFPFNNRCESASDNEEIFSQSTRTNISQFNTLQRKRVLDIEDVNYSERKRNKTISPTKQIDQKKRNVNSFENIDYNFKKPQLPVRKCNKGIAGPEILIAKSFNPLVGNVELFSNPLKQTEIINNLTETEELYSNQQTKQLSQTVTVNNSLDEAAQNCTDVSVKTSFMKRKLFTQKLDLVESKNNSSGNLGVNSPQTRTLKASREKNKVRKLVTSQSCLSREVVGDNNVLDLIHKIVPPDQMNITNVTNKKEIDKNSQLNDDKWDVASVISVCNYDNVSDTYTDEEIFNGSQEGNKKNKQVFNINGLMPKQSNKHNNDTQHKQHTDLSQCKVVIEKLPEICNLTETELEARPRKRCPVNLFWDTEGSDIDNMDNQKDLPAKLKLQDSASKRDFRECGANMMCSKKNALRSTVLNARYFGNRGVKTSIRSTTRDLNLKVPNKLNESKENIEDERNTPACSKSNKETCIKNTAMQNLKNTKDVTKHVNELEKLKMMETLNKSDDSNKDIQNRCTRSRSKHIETYVEIEKQNLKNSKNNSKHTNNQIKVKRPENEENNSPIQNTSRRARLKRKETHIDIRMQNSKSTSASKQVNKQEKLKRSDTLYDSNKNINNMPNRRSTQSQAKQDSRMQNLNNKSDTKKVHEKVRAKQTQKTPSKKNVESLDLNSSRQSLRLKQKKNATHNINNLSPIKLNHAKYTKINTMCNTSRESIRLKQKREARLFGCNTSLKT